MDTPGRGGVPGFPPKVMTGTDLRLDKVEGEGTPISVRSSADPYFFCCGEGREEQMTSWSYTVRMVTGIRKRGEERRLVKQGSLEGSGTCLDIFLRILHFLRLILKPFGIKIQCPEKNWPLRVISQGPPPP